MQSKKNSKKCVSIYKGMLILKWQQSFQHKNKSRLARQEYGSINRDNVVCCLFATENKA
jgi:hypothetical protein